MEQTFKANNKEAIRKQVTLGGLRHKAMYVCVPVCIKYLSMPLLWPRG